jgi:hypothetical protein
MEQDEQHRLHNRCKLQGCEDQRESRFSPNCTNRQWQVRSTPMP